MPETQVQSQSGKVPLAPEQLSLCATTTDLVLYSPRAAPAELTSGNYWSSRTLEAELDNKRGHRSEKPTATKGESPPGTTLKTSPHSREDPAHSKINT